MKVSLAILLVLISTNSLAGTATGKVTGYIPYSTGSSEIIFVQVENHVNSPTCNSTSRFTMLSTNPKFKSTNAALLAAFMSGTQIKAMGLDTCKNYSNSEDLNYVCLGGTIPC